MTNFTAAHESNSPILHPEVERPYRLLRFPDQHVEADNRLSWFLGTLDVGFGDRAYYVHLLRKREEVAASIATRGEDSILYAFASGILQHYRRARQLSEQQRYEIGLQFWDTVNDNIRLFLRDKPRQITMWLHDIKGPFQRFWTEIGAQGDLPAALAEWDVRHNPRKTVARGWQSFEAELERARYQLQQIIPPGQPFVLIDDHAVTEPDFLPGRPRVPFLQHDGADAGPPPDSLAAIEAVERLQRAGVRHLNFLEPAFWWLEHYAPLAGYLRSHGRCVIQNGALIGFELPSCANMEKEGAHDSVTDEANWQV